MPGDGLADIGSGPTTPDPSTQAQALEILTRYGCPIDPAVRAVLTDPQNETPKPGDPAFAGDDAHIVATAATALDAAQRLLESQGYRVTHLGNDLDDPARELGAAIAAARHGCRVALIQDRPVVNDNEIVIRPIMNLALSYDHRLIDGREAVGFLKLIKEYIEDPSELFLEL